MTCLKAGVVSRHFDLFSCTYRFRSVFPECCSRFAVENAVQCWYCMACGVALHQKPSKTRFLTYESIHVLKTPLMEKCLQ